jgi:type IV pilus assembly protein PilC
VPTFTWEGKTRTGESQKGEISAPSEKEAMAKLRSQQVTPSKVKQKGKARKGFGFKLPDLTGGVPQKQIVVFVRQFATMIDAGLPLVQCLDLLGSQEPHKAFKKVIFAVKTEVESGSTLADALAKHPKVFDTLFVNLVAAGEVGGILDTILNRLAAYIEKAMKLRGQVKSAMTYPIGILVVAFVVIFVLLWKVIPVFQKMFQGFGGAQLPLPTRIVVAVSDFVVQNFFIIIGLIAGSYWSGKTFYASTRGRQMFDAFILKTPLVGNLIRKVAVAKFTRTMGTMVASGVPILDALEIVAKSAGNHTIEMAINYTREKISEGKSMAEPLMETKVFPQMVVQMIAVGESTGAMDVMLTKIADFYEEEVDAAVTALTSLLEPFIMVFLGGVIGGVMIAMYMPIFEMAGNIKTG